MNCTLKKKKWKIFARDSRILSCGSQNTVPSLRFFSSNLNLILFISLCKLGSCLGQVAGCDGLLKKDSFPFQNEWPLWPRKASNGTSLLAELVWEWLIEGETGVTGASGSTCDSCLGQHWPVIITMNIKEATCSAESLSVRFLTLFG